MVMRMDIYEDIHYRDDPEHYHLGSEYESPDNQDVIFGEIIKLLKKKLPPHLKLRFNSYRSINIVDNGQRTYVFLNYYWQGSDCRVKITPYERGKVFFKSFLKPLIESIEIKELEGLE